MTRAADLVCIFLVVCFFIHSRKIYWFPFMYQTRLLYSVGSLRVKGQNGQGAVEFDRASPYSLCGGWG